MKTQQRTQVGGDNYIPARLLDLDLRQIFQNLQLIAFGAPTAGRKVENLDASWVLHIFGGAPNVDETVPHSLGRQPVGLIQVHLPPSVQGIAPGAGVVSFGSKVPTDSLVTLRCTVAGQRAAVILF